VADELAFDWDEANAGHVARHGVSPEEVQQVFANDPMDLSAEDVEGEQRYSSVGHTNRLRVLVLAWTMRGRSGTSDNGVRCERAAGEAVSDGEGILNMADKVERLVAPKFETEAQEAHWWYENRDRVEDALIKAMDNGTIQRGAAQRLASGRRVSRNVTIRLAEADLDLARRQAEDKGLPYQTYIKSVLHEALVKRERRRAG